MRPLIRPDYLGPVRPKEDLPSYLALPTFAEQLMHRYPLIKTLLSEMYRTDPFTFTHCVMGAQCFWQIAHSTLAFIEYLPGMDSVSAMDRITTFAQGYLFHDIGKWVLNRDPGVSATIVNSPLIKPIIESLLADNRPEHHRRLHAIHPQIGEFAIEQLALLVPQLLPTTVRLWQQIARWHHERFDFPASIKRTGTIYRYGKEFETLNQRIDAIVHLLVKLADTAVAMGQPRVYRKTRQPYTRIVTILTNILSDESLQAALGTLNISQLVVVRNILMNASFDALEDVQNAFHPNHCLSPPDYTFGNDLLSSISHEETPILRTIATALWNHHEAQVMHAANAVQL